MKKAFLSLLLLFSLSVAGTTAHADDCYSTGVRVGTVQKFSAKGLMNKSWEGQLVQDGLRTKGDSGVTNVWRFSVLDAAVARKIEDLTFAGKPLAVKYCQRAVVNPLVAETSYFITDAVAR